MPPAYYYHIKFELYPFSSTASLNQDRECLESKFWVPSPNIDIFHEISWLKDKSSLAYPSSKHEGQKNEIARLNPLHSLNSEEGPKSEQNLPRSKGNHCVALGSRNSGSIIDCGARRAKEGINSIDNGIFFENNRSRSFLAQKRKPLFDSLQNAEKDWRFGKVVIQGFETKAMDKETKDSRANNSISHEAVPSYSTGLGDDLVSDFKSEGNQNRRVTKAQFVPIIGNNSELGWGLVHLFRDGVETLSLEPNQDLVGDGDDCTTLCIPAVPSYLTPSDFLDWVGEKTSEKISHIRMVTTGKSTRYLVLLKFRDGMAARAWKKEWDGRAFNCMEPEICHVVFIKSITFCPPPSTDSASSTSFPALTYDPFTPTSNITPTNSLIELPTCPVCLERMDDTTGLLTILCQHVFHCNCLLRWKDSSCPVCRHTTQPTIDVSQEVPFGSGEASMCSICDCADDLWICLICGNVGCGRYKGGHAKEHWKETAHCFALEIETQHVWDYAGDIWVHRLIRDKGENSKVIELPSRTRDRPDLDTTETGSSPTVSRSKLDVLSIEYTHLVTSQLESQRLYFEDLIRKSAAKVAAASASAASATQSTSAALAKLSSLELDHAALKSELAEQSRDLEREKSKAAKSNEMARAMSKNLVEERRVSEGLMQRIEHLNLSIANLSKEQEALKAENRELSETNRDLLFCLSAGEKVREMEASGEAGLVSGELEAGVICLPSSVERKDEEKGGEKGKGKGKGKSKGRGKGKLSQK